MEVLHEFVGPIDLVERPIPLGNGIGERIPSIRRAEDRSGEVTDAADGISSQRQDLPGIEQSLQPALDSVHLPPTLDGAEGDRADHSVEPGRVSPSRAHSNTADRSRRIHRPLLLQGIPPSRGILEEGSSRIDRIRSSIALPTDRTRFEIAPQKPVVSTGPWVSRPAAPRRRPTKWNDKSEKEMPSLALA